MKRVIVILFMMVVFSSFVLSASSDIDLNFVVNEKHNEDTSYVSSNNFFWSYPGYFVLVFIFLVFFYSIAKRKKITRKKKKIVNRDNKKKSSKRKR